MQTTTAAIIAPSTLNPQHPPSTGLQVFYAALCFYIALSAPARPIVPIENCIFRKSLPSSRPSFATVDAQRSLRAPHPNTPTTIPTSESQRCFRMHFEMQLYRGYIIEAKNKQPPLRRCGVWFLMGLSYGLSQSNSVHFGRCGAPSKFETSLFPIPLLIYYIRVYVLCISKRRRR